MTSLRSALTEATAALTAAEVPSPRADALALVGHVLGADRGEVERRLVLGGELDDAAAERLRRLVEERATRVPLQHLTGTAPFRRLELHVGPGVFVPRPETEQAVDHVIAALPATDRPIVVDLCTGSGALALAVADETDAEVTAVELSDLALAWAARNVEATGLPVALVAADATADPREVPGLAGLVGRVDVVVSNPPYIPAGMVPLDPEVADHDPDMALYGGSDDGLSIPLAVAATAAALLRPGGRLVMEHADSQGESLPRALAATGDWSDVADHADLTGRARTTTARRGAGARRGPAAAD
ncbi:protein-(glutamine-N5) methyltransferase [Janibacter hoylei PVAS-1]|uniref:Release factor glutamine methyltransferase n=1 Tax=Janibacter hoylei PVAS-1 TaxID=1210046 RepID=K1E7E8_9MICO|nr:peptide chain release factor N(5)-glutamine methyltransferase [Janibacter hoylei]EKA61322.1 protein-(glutamine-N5) methyltransferase [Janibacter hoylei PVAS-1]RWU84503.1 peptide chain release factor N(5)-glutamine methyltransferase [Janibacter hoylei PVAS-1]